MLIHFICTGNVYRSRLAETYLNSKQLPNIHAISSGVFAKNNESGPISWYTQRILQNEKLISFETPTWQQTTEELLNSATYTIFLQPLHLKYCKERFNYSSDAYEVWDIPDLDGFIDSEIERIQATEETYSKIRGKVDGLINQFNK